jgi:DNA-binding response OmpR family regulator
MTAVRFLPIGAPVPRVLVVEDDADIREVLIEALVDDGYEVDWAADGVSGLSKACELSPQVVILDLMIPGLNGRRFVQECRRDPRCSSMNVIVVSAYPGERIGDLDVQAVIQKPFNLGTLMDTVAGLAPVAALEKT